jgi:hypothetical protein
MGCSFLLSLLRRIEMPTGEFGVHDAFRNQQVNVTAIGAEIPSVTTVAEAGTLNSHIGTVVTNSLDAIAGASETIVLTNNKVVAADRIQATIVGQAGTGTACLVRAVPTANTITFTIQNIHASAAFTGAVTIFFEVRKALTAGQPG